MISFLKWKEGGKKKIHKALLLCYVITYIFFRVKSEHDTAEVIRVTSNLMAAIGMLGETEQM